MSDELELHKLPGPLLLLAGPGTGKTYQLALRIKHLVEEKEIDPDAIAVITFTAAAAANMRARISDTTEQATYVSSNRQPECICTMHSLGYRIIRENAELLELSEDLSVLQADSTRLTLMGDAAQLAGFKRSDAKGVLQSRQCGVRMSVDSKEYQICAKYSAILRACSAIDYDDQILLACKLMKEHHEIADTWQTRAKHLLIDEYQDINAAQFDLIRALSGGQTEGLFAVGDDDQSIYSWRGGSPHFIRHFQTDFGATAKIKPLTHSRRCHRRILEASLRVVEQHDRARLTKGTFTYKHDDGSPVEIHSVPSDKREAAIVTAIIRSALTAKQTVLLLIPNSNYAQLCCDYLRKAKIKFTAKEQAPGTGLNRIERATSWLDDCANSIALRDCIEAVLGTKASPVPSQRVKKAEKLEHREALLSEISSLWRDVLDKKVSLWHTLTEAKDRSDLLRFAHGRLADLKARYEANDLPALLSQLQSTMEPWKKVTDFAEEIESWIKRSATPSFVGTEPVVQVMTFQGAKGLEAQTVCVIGVEDGVFPRAGCSEEELAESARLFFVSMTRAISHLHLFHCRTRSGAVSFQNLHAANGNHSLKRSPFLDAMPTEHCKETFHPAQS